MNKNITRFQSRGTGFFLLVLLLFFFITTFCGCNPQTKIIPVEYNEPVQMVHAHQTFPLPDVMYSSPGSGFTCTGLTYSPKSDTFYIGNFGMTFPSDSERSASIVQLSKNCSEVLSETPLNEIVSETINLQGISYDTSNDSFWIADSDHQLLYNININGELLTKLQCPDINGVAYDSRNDTLWVINNSSDNGEVIIRNLEKSGREVSSFRISGIYHSDQLYLDEKNNLLYFSAGANYTGENYVYALSLTTYSCTLKYVLGDSYAIEGIYILNDQLYVCNDGLYHSSLSNTNEMKIYNMP